MGTQTCRGTDNLPIVIKDEVDAPPVAVVLALLLVLVWVPGKPVATGLAMMLVLAVVLVLAMVLVLMLVVRKEEAGVRDVAATDFFFFLGGAPPLRPLPIGIPVKTKLVMFGRFLAFTNQSINPFSSPSISATATL